MVYHNSCYKFTYLCQLYPPISHSYEVWTYNYDSNSKYFKKSDFGDFALVPLCAIIYEDVLIKLPFVVRYYWQLSLCEKWDQSNQLNLRKSTKTSFFAKLALNGPLSGNEIVSERSGYHSLSDTITSYYHVQHHTKRINQTQENWPRPLFGPKLALNGPF